MKPGIKEMLTRPRQLNILDRSNISSAKVSGMPEDLGFGPVTYNNAV